ncbi:MAG: hypothetical protein A3K19_02700 [Lentisphaerae bacterium RIFOXYB12_FULL_65_16]|nr:MAG: hypothetical protein A3K18_16105 [Lentisphaerae bacterium RIFOXYA12_64_32]OGV92259.1 MAG: hypothetical protein A3K19_02700 [Lentisphaerae bacterium RIFOXYB12_FULL_65_16]
MFRHPVRSGIAFLILGLAAGCVTGPERIQATRTQYNVVLQQTANEQMLLNLVRLRYHEPVLFLEVSSLTSSFSLGANASASAFLPKKAPNSFGLGAGASLAEYPSVSYTPLQGEQYATRVLTEVDMSMFTRLYHAGWNLELLMRVLTERIADMDNKPGPTEAVGTRTPYGRFLDLAKSMRNLQERGSLAFIVLPGEDVVLSDHVPAEDVKTGAIIAGDKEGYRYVPGKDGKYELRKSGPPMLVMEMRCRDPAEAVHLAELLDIRPPGTTTEAPLVLRVRLIHYTDVASENPNSGLPQVPIRLRSMLDVLFYVAQAVDVPARDVKRGVVKVSHDEAGNAIDRREYLKDTLSVSSGLLKPGSASVSVAYRGHWFYIDDADLASKDTFALLGIVFAIQSGDVKMSQPVLTIPVIQ